MTEGSYDYVVQYHYSGDVTEIYAFQSNLRKLRQHFPKWTFSSLSLLQLPKVKKLKYTPTPDLQRVSPACNRPNCPLSEQRVLYKACPIICQLVMNSANLERDKLEFCPIESVNRGRIGSCYVLQKMFCAACRTKHHPLKSMEDNRRF